ncbi:PREDICTED: F-box protein At2g26160-like isoform X2 [Fragaria vesca subsp. vesca]|uniref:F-box protein At2g26160-like isoform X2 n=1 Tax=Fragaria vesca subsp. vesca TaxID=101020 RepID=UPI0002C2FF5F|nr:PREDICTED: F-box protein At2g26160-like isoform X2 [Fragaria vesca subsp. vesca]XP_011462999.1 PREDICTED: F-box protein At2g26160-like isoform X2 [Fragaria vesca subsp. vesca]
MAVVGKSPVKQGYRNPCTDVKDRSSMIEVQPGNNKNKRSLECEIPPDRSTKKPRRSDKDFALNTSYTSVSEWASLPMDIFFLTLDKLFELIDHVRLAVVCKHWNDVSKAHNRTTQRWCKVLPMLMIPFGSRTKRMVCSLSEGKIYTNVQLPVPYDKRCSGSSHGWLATADETFAITLLNPFRKAEAIHLPPLVTPYDLPGCQSELQKHRDELKKQYHYYVRKVILSADPSSNPNNYVVVAIYDNCCRLAFIRAGQRDWTYLEEPYMFSDAIFHRNEIYAVGLGGIIASVDINSSDDPSSHPKAIIRTPLRPMVHPVFPYKADKAYLVESSNGDLLHVRKFLKPKEGVDQKLGVVNFVVYKVLFSDKDGSIVKQNVVDSIGDDALFLGDNHSMTVLASNFPRCQPNSIYFTNDIWNGGIGIFSLANKTVTQLYRPQNPIPPAIWIVPPNNGLC